MHPDPRLRVFCRAIGRPVAGEFGEHLAEHALAAVAVDDALVVDEIGCGFGQSALRDALRHCLLLEVGQETIEAQAIVARRAAARGGCNWFCGGLTKWLLARDCGWPRRGRFGRGRACRG